MGVMELDLGALDLIIVQKRWNKINLKKNQRFEARHVIEITEVLEENNGIKLNPLFEFDFRKNKLKKKNPSLKVKEKIKRAFNFTERQLKKELKKREKFLEKAAREKWQAKEFFQSVQEEF